MKFLHYAREQFREVMRVLADRPTRNVPSAAPSLWNSLSDSNETEAALDDATGTLSLRMRPVE